MMFRVLALSLVWLVALGCLEPPPALPSVDDTGASVSDAEVDEPGLDADGRDVTDSGPHVELPPDAESDGVSSDADMGGPPGPFFPIPDPDSGEVAWWRMRWFESQNAQTRCVEPVSDYRSFAIVAVPEPLVPGTLSLRYIKDEACMYWGGASPHDFEYHVRTLATAEELGDVVVAEAFTIRKREDFGASISRLEEEVHRFDHWGKAPVPSTIQKLGPSGLWTGPPLAAMDPTTGDFRFDPTADGTSLGGGFPVSRYPTESDRFADTGAEDTGTVIYPVVKFRETKIDGIETQYVLLSLRIEDPQNPQISCEEWWFQRGIGPYASVAWEVTDRDGCHQLAAADDPTALADPVMHFEQNAGSANGWGIREDYCLGAECSTTAWVDL